MAAEYSGGRAFGKLGRPVTGLCQRFRGNREAERPKRAGANESNRANLKRDYFAAGFFSSTRMRSIGPVPMFSGRCAPAG